MIASQGMKTHRIVVASQGVTLHNTLAKMLVFKNIKILLKSIKHLEISFKGRLNVNRVTNYLRTISVNRHHFAKTIVPANSS